MKLGEARKIFVGTIRFRYVGRVGRIKVEEVGGKVKVRGKKGGVKEGSSSVT